MLAYRKRWNNTIDLSCEDFFKMKQFVQTGSKLQAVKHVKESAKCGLKEAKDFVDTLLRLRIMRRLYHILINWIDLVRD